MGATVKLVIMNGNYAGKEYVFDDSWMCLVGRGQDCDLRFPDTPEYRSISRRHCLLDIDPPCVRVRDLGSRNGTLINGQRLGPPANGRLPVPCRKDFELKDGDELGLADTVVQVQISTPAGVPEWLEIPADRPDKLVDVPDGEAALARRERDPAGYEECFHLPLHA
jgi:pSer/pThr/pTyr-binding forkhead associated (FHA) protein